MAQISLTRHRQTMKRKMTKKREVRKKRKMEMKMVQMRRILMMHDITRYDTVPINYPKKSKIQMTQNYCLCMVHHTSRVDVYV